MRHQLTQRAAVTVTVLILFACIVFALAVN
ncbi:hypothetical protein CLV47_11357 [Antricoccus suffuscus]|uniref:Uncharacterized protein n=1 Tax=Antricoccus suffuscus TaxID=1629062 RepID=A0A2T0ZX10_9ACTN|nr:hypothetical protein CLV47_11357 [Antricoccus suffuscus]